MKPQVSIGNAVKDGLNFGGWFVGDLKTWLEAAEQTDKAENYGLRETGAVEIKWGVHPKGTLRPGGWAMPSSFVTMSVLLRGAFDLHFRPQGKDIPGQRCQLRAEGDYAIWGKDCEHTWEAIEDTVILTVRWRPVAEIEG